MSSAFPSVEAVQAAVRSFVDGVDEEAVYMQLISVAEGCPSRTQEYAELAAKAVSEAFCVCSETPEPFENNSPVATKRGRAVHPDQPGLCGQAMGATIASVRTEDVLARGGATGNRYRNQACYEGAAALNATGWKVQLHRRECYTQACRALLPGHGPMHAAVVEQFRASSL
ncbi:unnamed protein product [Sphacelaria rigidula]